MTTASPKLSEAQLREMATPLSIGQPSRDSSWMIAYRKQSGISQSDLGKKLGVTFQQIQKYEKAVNRIGAGRLFEIANIFGVSVQSFYPDSEEIAQRIKYRTSDAKAVTEFALSVDGWKLFNAFHKITDARRRKMILALIRDLTKE
jgi:transcriptional regulator with XRE-family HTH domain